MDFVAVLNGYSSMGSIAVTALAALSACDARKDKHKEQQVDPYVLGFFTTTLFE